jgi:hypothetical protein
VDFGITGNFTICRGVSRFRITAPRNFSALSLRYRRSGIDRLHDAHQKWWQAFADRVWIFAFDVAWSMSFPLGQIVNGIKSAKNAAKIVEFLFDGNLTPAWLVFKSGTEIRVRN